MATILPADAPLGAGLSPAQIAHARAAAQQFEAMALGEMLEPIFDTVDLSKTQFGGGEAEQTWKPMLVQEIAKKIAQAGGLGLARPIMTEMLRMQEAAQGAGTAPPRRSAMRMPTAARRRP
ncbi:MAG TPA: rod-binding protein [Acetobacteraceae bacterium]|nr:rod-binding protein [Acetobacteraceae bacterium]